MSATRRSGWLAFLVVFMVVAMAPGAAATNHSNVGFFLGQTPAEDSRIFSECIVDAGLPLDSGTPKCVDRGDYTTGTWTYSISSCDDVHRVETCNPFTGAVRGTLTDGEHVTYFSHFFLGGINGGRSIEGDNVLSSNTEVTLSVEVEPYFGLRTGTVYVRHTLWDPTPSDIGPVYREVEDTINDLPP